MVKYPFLMQKSVLTALILSAWLGASENIYLGLFGTVVNLAKNDTLNVRVAPDYHAEKTAALPLDAYVGVDHCRKTGKSTWCNIFHIAQRDYEGFGQDAKPGWVNARYLALSNRGYVIIDNKPNCDYALQCQGQKCEVVDTYSVDEQTGSITSLKTRWINRKRLKASNHFGAMPDEPDASGYCTSGAMVDTFLQNKEKKHSDAVLENKVHEVVSALNRLKDGSSNAFAAYAHPLKGVTMTWYTHFGNNRHFSRTEIEQAQKNRNNALYWGTKESNGKAVHMSLWDYLHMLSRPVSNITKIERLKELKGFECDTEQICKGYEVRWMVDPRESNDWLGLVLIFEKYRGKWYVVGLLRDRWTV